MIFNVGADSGVENNIIVRKDKNLCLKDAVPSVLKVNTLDGESVQNGTPTPSVPVDIKSVVVSELKTTGKNLWSYGNASGTRYVAKNIMLDAGTYTVSALVTSSDTDSTESTMIFNYDDGLTLALHFTRNSRKSRKATFTKPVVSVNLYASNNYANSTNDTFTWSDIQIEKGEVASGYESYKETKATLSTPITLRGIGDIKDILCKQDGVYGVLRKNKHRIFNGIESGWSLQSINSYGVANFLYTLSDSNVNNGLNPLLNNRFQKQDTGISGTTSEGIYLNDKHAMYVRLSQDKASTVEGFKTWLSGNNLEVVYMLANSTFEPLPEADQLALKQLETFEKLTYVFTDSEIEPAIEVEYAKSKTGGLLFDVENNLGGCFFKYENGKFYIGHEEETTVTEV